jgi:hypothetical protein
MTTWLPNNPWANLPRLSANYPRIGSHAIHNRKSPRRYPAMAWNRCGIPTADDCVIASEAKQSIFAAQRKNGLLRFARNDEWDRFARRNYALAANS